MSIKLAMELIFAGIEDGGGTFDAVGRSVEGDSFPGEDEVYIVGGRYPGVIIRTPGIRGIIEATEFIAKWIDGCKNTLYYGSWVEGEDLYVDAVDIIFDRELAIDFAINRGQKAIYALKSGETVYVNGEDNHEEQGSEEDGG